MKHGIWYVLSLAALAGACGSGTKPARSTVTNAAGSAGVQGGGSAAGSGLDDNFFDSSLGGGGQTSGGSGGEGSATGSGPELCGGTPCAEHTGSQSFDEPSAPAGSAAIFANASASAPGTAPGRQPAILYPSHETKFPINVSRIRHEWQGGDQNTLFELRFTGSSTTVSIYTAEHFWEPSEEQWDWIAESNRGGEVELRVIALDQANPGVSFSSAPITLLFSDAEVQGAIYYWSTGSAGVMRAVVSSPFPEKFYTDPAAENAGTCVACHTVSRDGKRLAVGYGGEKLKEVSVPERADLVPAAGINPTRASAWTTFSPDGKKLLVAANGALTLIDADTGETIGPNAGLVPLPDNGIATHPDWNALGDRVAIALGTRGGNKEIEHASIALLPYNDGAWGQPEILVQAAGGEDNNYFPSWSPDSRWIIFANAQGKSKDALTAKLKLVSASGGEPVTLTRLNERVNASDGIIDIGNSMPTWAPSTKPGSFWVAFSSLRAYATLRPQDAKEDQIWIAAIDPALSDPGFSAFWAPFQSVQDGNHRAFWTVSGQDTQCLPIDVCGDSLDNDCNGTADDSECVTCQDTEICADGIDNDCDGQVDECVTTNEICDDGVDNDGDGQVDADDLACQSIIR
jgi:hypothetical protein